jgi:hypothetical protein
VTEKMCVCVRERERLTEGFNNRKESNDVSVIKLVFCFNENQFY